MNEWIDATVEQPAPYKGTLALEDGERYCIAYINEVWEKGVIKYEWRIPGLLHSTTKITHWMPLPEKPEKVTR